MSATPSRCGRRWMRSRNRARRRADIMRVLLGSGGFRTDERRALLAGEMRQHFGAIGRLLFVPYALADHDGYLRLIGERGLDAGYPLDGIHTYPDPKKAIREAV